MGTSGQREKRRKQGLGTWRLVRYSDDFVVMVNGSRRHAEALRAEVAAVLAPLGLRLAEEKTRVVPIEEGFDFLSFTIRRMRKRGTSKHYVYTIPSKKAIQAVKARVSAMTYRSTRILLLTGILPEAARMTLLSHRDNRIEFMFLTLTETGISPTPRLSICRET